MVLAPPTHERVGPGRGRWSGPWVPLWKQGNVWPLRAENVQDGKHQGVTSASGGPGPSPGLGSSRQNLWGPLACAVAAAVLAPVLALCLLMVPALSAFAGVTGGSHEVWPLLLVVVATVFLLLWGYGRLLRFLGESSPWMVALISLSLGVVLGMVYRPGTLGYLDWTVLPTLLWAFAVVRLRLTRKGRAVQTS